MINKYSILNGAKCFSSNGLQNYLVFQLFISHFKTKNDKVGTADKSLKQNSVSFLHKNKANLYITYKLGTWPKDINTNFTLGNSLFGAVKLTKNNDPDK